MSTSTPRRSRSELTAALKLPPGTLARLGHHLSRRELWWPAAWCVVTGLVIALLMRVWHPPFSYRVGDTPQRAVAVRTPFTVPDEEGTDRLRRQARARVLCTYTNDRRPLVALRKALQDSAIRVISAPSWDQLDEEAREQWSEFVGTSSESIDDSAELWAAFREALSVGDGLDRFQAALAAAFADLERRGLLVALAHGPEEGSQTTIIVRDDTQGAVAEPVPVSQVRIAEVMTTWDDKLAGALQTTGFESAQRELLMRAVKNWMAGRDIPTTLQLDQAATESARRDAEQRVELVLRRYMPGEIIAEAGQPLTAKELRLLRSEYEAMVAQLPIWDEVRRFAAALAIYALLASVCGWYVLRHVPALIEYPRQCLLVLSLVMLTVLACVIDHHVQWRVSVVPLTLFAMTIAITYGRELAVLLSMATALFTALSLGRSVGELMVVLAAAGTASLMVRRIRSRTKLIYVGMVAGLITLATALGVGLLVQETFGWSGSSHVPWESVDRWLQSSFFLRLLSGAVWLGAGAILSGILMTGLLPFVEKLFGIQTDLSLLELGDAAHPLLQQLVQRAPGTYNHSITVASLAESAADSIGANGLLVRVGAYFHDIGKMLKPEYFVENQNSGDNRHDSLAPAMSTLVIIAHVKDGADLARQYRLPESVVAFIEQHHGTTLVEYFYRQAAEQSQSDPDSSVVDETSFRYPGPKPQTLEAAVLMVADAAESACRTLSDPTPARIRHLVHELSVKRLEDGQFDECRLTLNQLRVIEDSLVKSLTAVYHGRVKYPDQQTA